MWEVNRSLDTWDRGLLDWILLDWGRLLNLDWIFVNWGGLQNRGVRVWDVMVWGISDIWNWNNGLSNIDVLIGWADVNLVGLGDRDDLLMTSVDTWLVGGDGWVIARNRVCLSDGHCDWCDGVCAWGWADIGSHHNLGGDSVVHNLGNGDRASDGGLGLNDGSNTTNGVNSRRQLSGVLAAKVLGAGQGHCLLRDGVSSWSWAGGDLRSWDHSMWNLNHGGGGIYSLNSGRDGIGASGGWLRLDLNRVSRVGVLNWHQVGCHDGSAWRWHFWWNTLLGTTIRDVPSVMVVVTMAGKSTPKYGGRREGNEAVLHDCEQERVVN